MAVTRCIKCTKDLDSLEQYCDDCRSTEEAAPFKVTPSATGALTGCATCGRADDDGARFLRFLRSSETPGSGVRRLLDSTVGLRYQSRHPQHLN